MLIKFKQIREYYRECKTFTRYVIRRILVEYFKKPLVYGYREISSSLIVQQSSFQTGIIPESGYKFESGYPYNNYVLFKFADLLKNTGDLLLCPVSDDFKLSNPLSRKINKSEKKKIQKELDHYHDIIPEAKTDHCIFLPIRHLKYRGVILVQMDFYSKERKVTNISRIAEAFSLAQRFNCCKFSLPKNILYDDQYYELEVLVEIELQNMAACMQAHDTMIDFTIEIIVDKFIPQKFRLYHRKIRNHLEKYTYTRKLYPFLREQGDCWFLAEEYMYSRSVRKKILKILTDRNTPDKDILWMIKYLKARLDHEYDTGVGRGNLGFENEILELLRELPWNGKRILVALEKDRSVS